MKFDAVQRILGLLLMLFSSTLLPALAISLWAGDGAAAAFVSAFVAALVVGLLLWLPVRRVRRELRTRDGFFITALFWLALGLTGALPFVLVEQPQMSVVDAVFESLSGLTTTGATVIVGIDELPLSLRFYRQQLQWMGGMGIVVLAVAILPMLGVGGMQLYRAEMPGPIKDTKLTPRITETAKALWYVYLALTVACALAYWAAGMSPFDAIAHSFSTVATGGFSTYDANIAHFDSPLVELVCMLFVYLGAINFSLHFMAWRRRSPRPYAGDGELRFFSAVLLAGALLVVAALMLGQGQGAGEALRAGVFQVVSFATTAGFTSADYASWSGYAPMLLIFLALIGGCASSTAGGIKIVRFMLLFKQGQREIMRLIHPQAQIQVKFGGRAVSDRVIDAVWGFFATYVAVFAIMLLLLLGMGIDQVTAFSALVGTLGNLGPGLGGVAAHYGELADGAKWLLSLAMVMGRLEIFTLLVLFTPAFWRG